jgi:alkylresorcinol/alkylpyrone synthase
MPKIEAVHTAVPRFQVAQHEIRQFAEELFRDRLPDLDRLLPLFENTGIERRHFTHPISWYGQPHTLGEKNEAYLQHSTDLGVDVCTDLLHKTHTQPHDIDYIIYINSTGLATPSIDARLINKLGLRRDIRRTPVWGLGCAGGAAGLSQAYHYLLGHPKERVLLVAVELCGLTFISEDYSKSNLVACALFADGAGAVLMSGDEVAGAGVEILGTQSRFYPDSLDVMGWNIVAEGMQVVFAQRIPDIVTASSASDLGSFLAQHELTIGDISDFIFHPGGRKVIEAYEQALALTNGKLSRARAVLRDYGNMSSVTVLFVLEKYQQMQGSNAHGYGLISALGPGFCSESLLIRR